MKGHRAIYQSHFGEIPPGFVVHHLNGDHEDNRPFNLIAVPKVLHGRYHSSVSELNQLKYMCINPFKETANYDMDRNILSMFLDVIEKVMEMKLEIQKYDPHPYKRDQLRWAEDDKETIRDLRERTT